MSSPVPYAELHCHSHFSFLDGASPPDELIERALALGLTGLAITDHQGLYGVVRFAHAALEAGLRPIVGLEIELVDALVADPDGVVVPARRPVPPGRRPLLEEADGASDFGRPIRSRRRGAKPTAEDEPRPDEGRPLRPRPHPDPAARSSRVREGGPARHRRGAARPAPPAARSRRRRLSDAVPARESGEHGGHEGRATVHPGDRSPSTLRAWSRYPAAARASSRDGCASAIGRAPGRSPSATRQCSGAGFGRRFRFRAPFVVGPEAPSHRRRRVRRGASAPPSARRRLACRGARTACRRGRAAGRRHERRPLRDSLRAASFRTW